MPVQRLALVLGEDVDPEDSRIDEVREHEVDDPVAPAEGHRRLRAVAREGRQSPPFATRQHHPEDPHGPRLIARQYPAVKPPPRAKTSAARPRLGARHDAVPAMYGPPVRSAPVGQTVKRTWSRSVACPPWGEWVGPTRPEIP